jgi:hypothetical protein
MVRAILAGTKTQTRRAMKPQTTSGPHDIATVISTPDSLAAFVRQRCPYGKPGERLWLRETFQRFTDDGETLYRADPKSLEAMNQLKRDGCLEAFWRPSIHMPRWASRITLEITGVRVERLQDISEADAIAEGVDALPMETRQSTAGLDYRALWESINGPGSWDANPWVWCIEFKRVPQGVTTPHDPHQ